MEIIFSDTKDGNQTFSAEGLFYHSKYSPQTEAERFVQSFTLPFSPDIIFLLEPGLDYCSNLITQKFPQAKTAVIRLFDSATIPEGNWDYIISFTDKSLFKQQLLSAFGEEKLLSSAIFVWPAAKNVFKTQVPLVCQTYKEILEECKTLLVTRQFFEKKWLINSYNFAANIQKPVLPQIKEEQSIVICASGPSLVPSIQILKNYRDRFILFCLSSATSILLNNDIIPDLVITTDGGYWAGHHLKQLKAYKNIPVAAPAEALLPKKLLAFNNIIPLEYEDESSFISTGILKLAGIKTLKAVRNPTVSGTALYLALSFKPKNVFFCGLDLCSAEGFAHAQPNELEINNSCFDNKIKSKTGRIASANFNSSSLKIYEEWFCKFENPGNIIRRIINNEYKHNELGNIKDIQVKEFENLLDKISECTPIVFLEQNIKNQDCNSLCEYILNNLKTEKWQKQLFPADFISMKNSLDQNNIDAIKTRLDKKIEQLVLKIRKKEYAE
ncbi:MAG: DUF115 domain-containing protein [Treponema sp.]|nr:DUF115 domain-containing protein [Treponema sp.]